jgi:D-arabinonate dehydratase
MAGICGLGTGLKITNIDFEILVWPELDPPFWMSLLPVNRPHELILKVHTDAGITGIGHTDQIPGAYQINSQGKPEPGNASRIIPDLIAPILFGKNPLEIDSLWAEMFQVTYRKQWNRNGWTRGQLMAVIAATDMALWDIAAIHADKPVFRLLGGKETEIKCYMAGGYYRDGKTLEHLRREMEVFRRDGFKAVKMRVGGDSLAADIERVAVAREALRPDTWLMLDANEAYESNAGIEAAKAFAPYDIFWFEEPARWYEGSSVWKRVAEEGGIPVAGGEQAAARWEAANLVESGAISYMEFDGMRTGGPSEWLKVAAICENADIPMVPHHGPLMHAHLVSAVPNGLMVEVFPDPAQYGPDDELEFTRWDRKCEMFSSYPEIVGGNLVLPETPGWGFELDDDAVGRLRVRE